MHFNEICSHTTISTDTVDNQKLLRKSGSHDSFFCYVILKDPLTDPPATPPIMPPTILPTIVPTSVERVAPITAPTVLPIRETAAPTK